MWETWRRGPFNFFFREEIINWTITCVILQKLKFLMWCAYHQIMCMAPFAPKRKQQYFKVRRLHKYFLAQVWRRAVVRLRTECGYTMEDVMQERMLQVYKALWLSWKNGFNLGGSADRWMDAEFPIPRLSVKWCPHFYLERSCDFIVTWLNHMLSVIL